MADKEEFFDDIDFDSQTQTITKVEKPNMYKVILLNDDYTTMDFVVRIIVEIFKKSAAEATKIMQDVHNKGRGIVGVYTYDIAVSKVEQVHRFARENDFPLRCIVERA